MAFTFLPGVRISGEPAGGEALRVERGVEGEDMVDYVVFKRIEGINKTASLYWKLE